MRTLIMLGDNEAEQVSASSHEADDVSLDRGVVTFRPTAARRWCAAWTATSDRCARAEVVEYRVEQHLAKLGERVAALQARTFGTTIDTTGMDSQPSRVGSIAATPRA